MAIALLAIIFAPAAQGFQSSRLQVTLDSGEAAAAIDVLEKIASGATPSNEDWNTVFETRGYQRLKQREQSLGRTFTEAEFRSYLQSPEMRTKVSDLRRALDGWKGDPSGGAAMQAFAYLPPGTTLRATVYLTLKPKPNEFVFDITGDPAIFLVLDPSRSPDRAANTIAHELHHIGMGAACSKSSKADARAPQVATLQKWTSAFGEGLAVMAAAGGPDIHPHLASSAAERAEWDRNVAQFADQLKEQDQFFRLVLDGRAGSPEAIETKMRGYFGVQGPWYTVGWKMAQVIETELGRDAVIAAFCDSGQLPMKYNEAARLHNDRGTSDLPLWTESLAAALAGG